MTIVQLCVTQSKTSRCVQTSDEGTPFNYLTVRMVEVQAREAISVGQSLYVDCLLWKSFTNHHVEDILPGLEKVVFLQFSFVVITGHRHPSKAKTPLTLQLEDRP